MNVLNRINDATSAVRRARGVFLCLLALSLPDSALAWTAQVTVDDDDGLYHVRGSFITHAPPQVTWDVLTDYDNIDEFVKSLDESEVRFREGDVIRIRQQASTRFMFVKRTVQVELDLKETRYEKIEFTDVLEKDFRIYRGEWHILVDENGTTVLYSLRARLRAAVPHVLVRRMLSGNARSLLEQVEAEVVRRMETSPDLPWMDATPPVPEPDSLAGPRTSY